MLAELLLSFGCPFCSNFAEQILSRPNVDIIKWNLIELSIQNGASGAGIVVIALNNAFFVKVNAINLIQFALQ